MGENLTEVEEATMGRDNLIGQGRGELTGADQGAPNSRRVALPGMASSFLGTRCWRDQDRASTLIHTGGSVRVLIAAGSICYIASI